ncbi:MAG TPA: CDP-alcohol phosphatidyltransferase family protein [Kofleriaceae bacterium]|nr:CDP-alcohol phosphatidyltransferase family protein [Kofleriaceae bacterium]
MTKQRKAPMFGVKDLFTTINLMGGVVAVCLCIDGQPYYAGMSVILGYLLGDTMDGYIARKLGTANLFGAEFDTISDHMSHVIAPSAIVYTVYRGQELLPEPWMNQVLAILLAGSLVFCVSVRHARNIVSPVEYKGVWAGLPRSVVGFWAVAYCNAATAPDLPGGYWIGVVLIPAMAIATLTYFPFPSHRMARMHKWYVRVLIVVWFASMGASIVIAPRYVFDLMFFWMTGYSLFSWRALSGEELARFRETVDAAKARA